MTTRRYVELLRARYSPVRIAYPPFRYTNAKTLVCSYRKGNPQGKFTTVGVYFLIRVSAERVITAISVLYSNIPVPFDEIYSWAVNNVGKLLAGRFEGSDVSVERVLALTFQTPKKKPDFIEARIGGR